MIEICRSDNLSQKLKLKNIKKQGYEKIYTTLCLKVTNG